MLTTWIDAGPDLGDPARPEVVVRLGISRYSTIPPGAKPRAGLPVMVQFDASASLQQHVLDDAKHGAGAIIADDTQMTTSTPALVAQVQNRLQMTGLTSTQAAKIAATIPLNVAATVAAATVATAISSEKKEGKR